MSAEVIIELDNDKVDDYLTIHRISTSLVLMDDCDKLNIYFDENRFNDVIYKLNIAIDSVNKMHSLEFKTERIDNSIYVYKLEKKNKIITNKQEHDFI